MSSCKILRLIKSATYAGMMLLLLTLVLGVGCKRSTTDADSKSKNSAASKKGDSDEFAYKRANGEVVYSAGGKPIALPAEFPADIAIYPEATVVMAAIGENESSVILNTSDSVKKIVAFYKRKLKEDGWKFDKPASVPDFLETTKEDRSLSVDIRIQADSGKTSICLALTKRKAGQPTGDAKPSTPSPLPAADSWQNLYEAKTYENAAGQKLLYRLLKPAKIEPGKQYPLVLFLHGLGERGSDNVKQLVHGAGEFAKPANRQKYPCFVVAPQCPGDKRWVRQELKELNSPQFAMTEKPAEPLMLVLELLDKLPADLPVDKDRIYVTGLSMGGFGTWDLVQRRPEFFAAAIPICGRGDSAQAAKLKNLPIWAFHGEQDPLVPVSRTKTMIEAVRQAGGTPKMTLYPGVGHDSWTQTYADPAVMAWLFAQSANKPAPKTGAGK